MARGCFRRAVAESVVLMMFGAVGATAQPRTADVCLRATGAARPVRPVSWPRLDMPDPVARISAEKALNEAWQLLAQEDCAAVLGRFLDSAGRPLSRYLEGLSIDAQTYLTLVVFVDGTREVACFEGVFAFTVPGSRVVRLCVDELKRTARQSPRHTAANFIHEMLHSLGLGENPPSSTEITARVLAACHREK